VPESSREGEWDAVQFEDLREIGAGADNSTKEAGWTGVAGSGGIVVFRNPDSNGGLNRRRGTIREKGWASASIE